MALILGCGDPGQRRDSDLERTEREKRAKAASGEASGGGGLPGPPNSTPAPRSADPEIRQIEERLFGTDGGRVVLKALRAHGGWEKWRTVEKIAAVIRSPETGPMASAAPPPAPPSRALSLNAPAASLTPKSPRDTRLLAGPFYFASPALRLEYLGVEVDAETGDAYDKLRVWAEEPGSGWCIAYFVRRNALFARLLEPSPEGGAGASFDRFDLSDVQEVGGLQFPTRWTRYSLPDRYAHADLKKPEQVELLKIEVVSSPQKR
jgi:hypothetical protein